MSRTAVALTAALTTPAVEIVVKLNAVVRIAVATALPAVFVKPNAVVQIAALTTAAVGIAAKPNAAADVTAMVASQTVAVVHARAAVAAKDNAAAGLASALPEEWPTVSAPTLPVIPRCTTSPRARQPGKWRIRITPSEVRATSSVPTRHPLDRIREEEVRS